MNKALEMLNWASWGAAAVSLGFVMAAVAGGLILYWLIFRVLFRFAARPDTWLDHVLD